MPTITPRSTRIRTTLAACTTGLVLVLAAVPLPAQQDPPATEVYTLSSNLRVHVRQGRDIELEVLAAEGDDYSRLARLLSFGPESAPGIAAWNADRRVAPGTWVRVPLSMLSADYRRLVLQRLFPADAHDGQDWVHLARKGVLATYDEGLWQVAEWFTGDGTRFRDLMQANDLSSPELRADQVVRIPAKMLHPAFVAGPRSADDSLEFRSDATGPYAGYRLRAGEALYSAVVGRFSGRTRADDVHALAEQLRKRSGIRDLHDIPVGFEIKIPLDLLEWRYLPAGHPRRLEAEAAEVEMAQVLARKPVSATRGGLEGVLVLIDPGHGGRDLGTMNNGIWEHDYVYDVACRLREKLIQQTAARVVMTLEDRKTGYRPSRTDKLEANRQGTILTTPPFLAREEGEARIGVNLRWYLANSVYRKALSEGFDEDRIVFVSLHADSRHPSLRGLMVYVPGAGYRTKTYGSSAAVYSPYEEVREKRKMRFSQKDRVRSEAVSRKFSAEIVRAFKQREIPVHPHQPVRHRIIRGKQRFVPAVIGGNSIPTKVLVEMVNLSNPQDAALLASARKRDRLAEALTDALFLHFGEKRPAPGAD